MQFLKNILVGVCVLSVCVAQDYDTCSPDEHLMDPPECPPFEQIPTYFPYPYDCTKYFECTNGDARCIQCPTGTRWDQTLKTCNHDYAVECVIVTTGRPSTLPTTTTPTTTTPTTTTPTTTTPTTTTPTTTPSTTTTEDPAEWICPEGFLGAIGHPFDCTHFYICDPGRRPCLFACPAGLYWSPVTKDCTWPELVSSCQGGTPPPPTTRQPVNYRNIERAYKADIMASFMKRRSEGGDPCQV